MSLQARAAGELAQCPRARFERDGRHTYDGVRRRREGDVSDLR